MLITKRDGRKVEFDETKIINAIRKAFEQTENEKWDEYAVSKATNIASFIKDKVKNSDKEYDVEQIQDLVENGLMSCKKKNVAREYIKYRAKRNELRNKRSEFNKIIREKLMAENVQNQNANVDEYSFGGRVGEASDELSRRFSLENILSEMARKNHENNEIYTHDLTSAMAVGMHNCLTIPFDDLLKNGFVTRQQDIRPASSVSTALQLIAVIFQCQSLVQFGGTSASHLDWTLVPYVRKSFSKHMKDGLRYVERIEDEEYINSVPNELRFDDEEANDMRHREAYDYAMKMTEKETSQAVEGFFHNCNSLQSRAGSQLPFTSINYGTCTLEEGRMVTRAILENSIKGGGRLHRTYIFPCQIFQCMKGVNRKEGEPNYDLYKLALKSTSLRLYPNYANVDWSVNEGYDRNDPDTFMSTMGLLYSIISPYKTNLTLLKGCE
jgi:ribonucleoside-triphosphate reductase